MVVIVVKILIIFSLFPIILCCENNCVDSLHGICQGSDNDTYCVCQIGWQGADCSVSWIEELGAFWYVYMIVPAILFFLNVALVAWELGK